jgi:CRP-like cAMP-binding protein
MDKGALGKVYQDGEIIICQGEVGNCMYVIQEGKVAVLIDNDGQEVQIAVREQGDFIGEMAIFERDVRSATVRALGPARVLTIDKKNFLRRISQDPSLAFRMVETMSHRIRELSQENAQLMGKASKSIGRDEDLKNS